MRIRKDVWCGATHYYTRCNRNGTWEVVEDMSDYNLESRVVYSGNYRQCERWLDDRYAESLVTW